VGVTVVPWTTGGTLADQHGWGDSPANDVAVATHRTQARLPALREPPTASGYPYATRIARTSLTNGDINRLRTNLQDLAVNSSPSGDAESRPKKWLGSSTFSSTRPGRGSL